MGSGIMDGDPTTDRVPLVKGRQTMTANETPKTAQPYVAHLSDIHGRVVDIWTNYTTPKTARILYASPYGIQTGPADIAQMIVEHVGVTREGHPVGSDGIVEFYVKHNDQPVGNSLYRAVVKDGEVVRISARPSDIFEKGRTK